MPSSHTWAVFAEDDGGRITARTISWLPRSGVIVPLRLGPERGRNYSLAETFAFLPRDSSVAQWGPYEITDELFQALSRQYDRLLTGDFWYRVIDTPNRIFKALDPSSSTAPRAMHCAHAVADATLDIDRRGFLLMEMARGYKATAKVAWHFAPHLRGVDEWTKASLDRAIGLSAYGSPSRVPLTRDEGRYCNTLEECRKAMFPTGG